MGLPDAGRGKPPGRKGRQVGEHDPDMDHVSPECATHAGPRYGNNTPRHRTRWVPRGRADRRVRQGDRASLLAALRFPDLPVTARCRHAAGAAAPGGVGRRQGRYPGASGVQAFAGTSRVVYRSGQYSRARKRYACSKPFRNTLFQYAWASVQREGGANDPAVFLRARSDHAPRAARGPSGRASAGRAGNDCAAPSDI